MPVAVQSTKLEGFIKEPKNGTKNSEKNIEYSG